MTQITMIYDNNLIIGFRMEGHAGYNQGGPDILCASLSTASQMTINGILDWTGLSLEDLLIEGNSAKAILRVHIPEKLHESVTIQQILRSFEMYIEQLSEQYEDYIKFERRQKNDM